MTNLIICNNVYQILVALWIVHRSDPSVTWDMLISDHMKLADRLRDSGLFRKVYHIHTLKLTKNQRSHSLLVRIRNALFPMMEVWEYAPIRPEYDSIYFANFDNFSQVLYNGLNHRNPDLKLFVYEEGLASYSSFARFYSDLKCFYGSHDSRFKKFLHQYIYRTSTIPGHLTGFLVFNPQLIQWDPECEIQELEKIDSADAVFRNIVNSVFDFNPAEQEYNTKYLFFEESFFADGADINDVALIEALAARVGKENITIKIHPRNPVNRFSELGYKTNRNTAIPWEVVVMNAENLENQIMITIASSCILNPIIVFGRKVQAYSLYECLNKIPFILQNGYWDLVDSVYRQYPDMIHKCSSVDDIP